jgi:type IV pilus assembly protein PilB
MTDENRTLVLKRASAAAIAEVALSQGMRRLRDAGLDQIREGVTTVPEVLRTTGSY